MTSLSNVYGEENRDPSNGPGRNRFGFILMGLGVLLTLGGVLLGTTPILLEVFNSTVDQTQLFSGILGGFGILSIIGGMLHSVPDKSSIETKIGLFGVALCAFGVILFGVQFPNNWNIYKIASVPLVGFSYAVGMLTLLGITFHAVVNHRMKSTEQFTITHRFESDERTEPQRDPEPQEQRGQQEPQGGGVGVIGNLSSDARKTYGPRNPMTKQDREKHSLGGNNNSDKNRK